jgi:hypothetical protein
MAVTVQLPRDVEQQLRAEFPDLERHIVEGWAVEAYRRGELSSYQVGQILGLENRWETVEFLSKQGVYPNYGVEQFEEDIRALERLKERRP